MMQQPFSKLLQQLRGASSDNVDLTVDEKVSIKKDLISAEGEIGGRLFGPLPAGHDRDFFCLDEHTWVWSESYRDEEGRRQTLTTRYELRGSEVMKIQNGIYYRLSLEEKKHLKRAIELYYQQVMQSVYPQYANKSIA